MNIKNNFFFDSLAFITFFSKKDPRRKVNLENIGRHFFWVFPTCYTILYTLVSLVTIGLYQITDSALFSCVVHFFLLHFINGFKRIDGLNDLGEGLLYKINHPDSHLEKVWKIIRSPGNGAYGTAIIVCYFLLLVSTGTLLLKQSVLNFAVFSVLSGVFSTVTLAFSIAPKHFTPNSDFYAMIQCISAPYRKLMVVVAAGCLVIPFVFIYKVRFIMIAGFVLLIFLAILLGFMLRAAVIKILKEMNGDIMGFSLCVGELCLLLVSAIGLRLL